MKKLLITGWMVTVLATNAVLAQSDEMFPSDLVPMQGAAIRVIEVDTVGNDVVDPTDNLISINATVQLADGSPVEGAIVVTSAGGQGVSDANGDAHFTVSVPASVAALHVTGMVTLDSVNHVGTVITDLLDLHNDVGTIILSADCESAWLPTSGAVPGVLISTSISAFTVFDDGSGDGPALIVGGSFTSVQGLPISRIAKWTGEKWIPLGDGISGSAGAITNVQSLVVFDDGLGGGPALYAGGHFTQAGGLGANHIARWDGSSWSTLGSGLASASTWVEVRALAVFDDGTGSALFVGGRFDSAGSVPAQRIAKWDGTSWSPVGGGVSGGQHVAAFAQYDDGSGSALYVGGNFSHAGSLQVNGIAKWNGNTWSALDGGVATPTGMPSSVGALAVFDDGIGGSALYAGGGFAIAGGVPASRIAKWDGQSWIPMGTGLGGVGTGAVRALVVFDDGMGKGPALYVGGTFTNAGGSPANRIARWDGLDWVQVGEGASSAVNALGVFGEPMPMLYAGGQFSVAGNVWANGIAAWNGEHWYGLANGVTGTIHAMAHFDDGSGRTSFVGGAFTGASGTLVNSIAKWQHGALTDIGGVTGGLVHAMIGFEDETAPSLVPGLYIGGSFKEAGGISANRVAHWDGTTWSPLGSGFSANEVRALATFDDGLGNGPLLYAGGTFFGGRISKWDGVSWSPLGSGMNGAVEALAVFDDGDGPLLYAAGSFSTAGGTSLPKIAKWDGNAWSGLTPNCPGSVQNGCGFNGIIYALRVVEPDTNVPPGLYVGGDFSLVDGIAASNLVRWDGSAWHIIGEGINGPIRTIEIYDDGTGSGQSLYVGGAFTTINGIAATRIARWDGIEWSPLGAGVSGSGCTAWTCDPVVHTLLAYTDDLGHASDLFVGGHFINSPANDSHFARWGGCHSAAQEHLVHFDIRPGDCPKPLNAKAQGILPAAILGTPDFDVALIDKSTIALMRADGVGGSIAPFTGPPGPGVKIEDVSAPPDNDSSEGDVCDCHESGPDGIPDLALKFSIPQLAAALELHSLASDTLELKIVGELIDGTPIEGSGCVKVIHPADLNADGVVNVFDMLILLSTWGPCADPFDCPADFEGTGVVNVFDMLFMLASWG